MFKILTKLQPESLNQTSASKFQPNYRLKIITGIQRQNLDQTSAIYEAYSHFCFRFSSIPEPPSELTETSGVIT